MIKKKYIFKFKMKTSALKEIVIFYYLNSDKIFNVRKTIESLQTQHFKTINAFIIITYRGYIPS